MKAIYFFCLCIFFFSCKPSNAPDLKHELSKLNAWIDSIELATSDNQSLDSLSWSLINEEFNSQIEALSIQKLNEQDENLLNQTQEKWKVFEKQYHHDMLFHIDSFIRAAVQDSIDADTSIRF